MKPLISAILEALSYFVLSVIGVVCVLYACGCAKPPKPVAPRPVEVKIVEMPDRPSCWLQDLPEPPQLKELNFEVEDVTRRVMVHYLDHNLVVQYLQDLSVWMADVERCVYALSGSEP